MTRRVSVGDSDPATEHRPWHVYLPVKVHFFYSSCMRTVRLKTSEYALIGSHYDWLGADLFPARRGHTKRRMKNLWHPGYGRMRTTLRLPPSHHALQRFNETTVDDSWSAALIQSLAQRTIFPFVKWETSAHRLGAGSYYICLRFHRCSDGVSRRTIIIKTRFFLLWLF